MIPNLRKKKVPNMDTIVLKFGGSSVADNIKLNIVANKIIDLYKTHKIIVVVSAQGKTTDKLLKEAYELSAIPNNRELDVLLSSGEQIAISKLSILLNQLGYETVSLTGWQAGIITNNTNQNAIINFIDTQRIEKELEQNKIVIVAGFQGINENLDISTLGRGGSDTTAVAIASALKAKHCYIFSDVDGVYTTDPNKVTIAKKLDTLSYVEMLEIADEGAKVLHNRCINIAEKFKIPIVTKSTFNNANGTIIENKIQDKIEDNAVKSIVKNDDLILINLKYETYSIQLFNQLYESFVRYDVIPLKLINNSIYNLDIHLVINSASLNKFQILLESELKMFNISYNNISKISIIGSGINTNTNILKKILEIINLNKLDFFDINLNSSKIAILFNKKLSNSILEQLHNTIIE